MHLLGQDTDQGLARGSMPPEKISVTAQAADHQAAYGADQNQDKILLRMAFAQQLHRLSAGQSQLER